MLALVKTAVVLVEVVLSAAQPSMYLLFDVLTKEFTLSVVVPATMHSETYRPSLNVLQLRSSTQQREPQDHMLFARRTRLNVLPRVTDKLIYFINGFLGSFA